MTGGGGEVPDGVGLWRGSIDGAEEDRGLLESLGVKVGLFRAHTLCGTDTEPRPACGTFDECAADAATLDRLDPYWGRFVWSLEPPEGTILVGADPEDTSDVAIGMAAIDPGSLSRADLEDIVRQVQAALYLDVEASGEFWNSEKQWDPDTIQRVGAVLARHQLVPTMRPGDEAGLATLVKKLPGPGRNDRSR